MKIILTEAATADLAELRIYLEPLNPAGLRRVTQRLEKIIEAIPANPRIGRITSRNGVRELIEPRYGFLVPYAILNRTVFVLRLYRSRREPLNYETLKVPGDAGKY
ncbi:MAG: type II toxin-antitoxin system RelE/ParE family toxin [Rhizobiales bacterium]|nr:type II toxin-antitoxin system RelE/ParE family toxin [Hyphomicrobiales bacterium]